MPKKLWVEVINSQRCKNHQICLILINFCHSGHFFTTSAVLPLISQHFLIWLFVKCHKILIKKIYCASLLTFIFFLYTFCVGASIFVNFFALTREGRRKVKPRKDVLTPSHFTKQLKKYANVPRSWGGSLFSQDLRRDETHRPTDPPTHRPIHTQTHSPTDRPTHTHTHPLTNHPPDQSSWPPRSTKLTMKTSTS